METQTRPQVQFSLRDVLAGTTILGLALTIGLSRYRTTLEISELRRALRQAKQEHKDQVFNLDFEHRLDVSKLNNDLDRLRHNTGMPDTSDPKRVTFMFNFTREPSNGTLRFRIHQPSDRRLVVCLGIVENEEAPLPDALDRCRLVPGKGIQPFYPQLQEIEVHFKEVDDQHFTVLIGGDILGGMFTSKSITGSPNVNSSSGNFQDSFVTKFPSDLRKGPDTPAIFLYQSLGSSGILVFWLEDEATAAKDGNSQSQ